MNSEVMELKIQIEDLQKRVRQLDMVNKAIIDIIEDINEVLKDNVTNWKIQSTVNQTQNFINSSTCAEFRLLKE